MATTLFHYLNDLKINKLGALTDDLSIIRKKRIDLIVSGHILDLVPAAADRLPKKTAVQKLNNEKFFQILGIPKEDIGKIKYDLSDDQVNQLISVIKKSIIILHPRKTTGVDAQTIHDYEDYLRNTYASVGITASTHDIMGGTPPIKVRERYPHEEDSLTGIDVIYDPDNNATKEAIKNHYLEYYEKQIRDIIPATLEVKNKADFISLLNDIKNNNAYPVNQINDPNTIDSIINELNADTSDQMNEANHTTISIPATYIIGQHSKEFKIVMKEETYQRIKTKLNEVFGNRSGNNISVRRVTLDILTVDKIARRNQYIINRIKSILRDYEGRNRGTAENLAKPVLTRMLAILEFDRTTYTDTNQFTELIGGYIPNDKVTEFLKCAKRLAQPDINFNFQANFPHFMPIRMPGIPPQDSTDIRRIEEYEKGLKESYKEAYPEIFHTDEYNYKKNRKKYSHEMFKWRGDEPNISDKNSNLYTEYYDSVYKDYMDYRKKDRPVVKIKKAPGKLVSKVFNSNEVTRTFKDILLAFHRDYNKKGDDGTLLSEANKRAFGVVEKLKLNAILAGVGITIKGFVSGFSLSMLGPAAAFVGVATVAMEAVTAAKRIYTTYREIMEERVSISYSKDGLKEAEKYKRLIATADPVNDAEKIERYKTIIKAYVAYYIANYNKFMRSYNRLKKNIQYAWQDEKESMEQDETRYRTTDYVDYWDDGKAQVPNYTDLNRDEFKEKIEAIEHGRRRY